MKIFLPMTIALMSVALLAPSAQAQPRGTLKFDIRTSTADVVFTDPNNNQQPDVGEGAFIHGVAMRRGTNRRVGTIHATNTVVQVVSAGTATTPPDLRLFLNGVVRLRGGAIFVTAITGSDPRVTERGAVIGGTRHYRGARGEFTTRIIEQTEQHQLERVTIRFTR